MPMANRIHLAPGETYHLYNRGTEKRTIFTSKSDYERFLALLYLSNVAKPVHISNHQGSTLMDLLAIPHDREPLVDILAYCLMPNHFHLLVREGGEGNISRFMQKLLTGYTMYFNTRRERSGALMQGTFKASHADTERYFKYLFSYIHLNPIKLIEPAWQEAGIHDHKKAAAYLAQYRYSSYSDYTVGERPESVILNKKAALDYFDKPTDFKTQVADWLEYRSEVRP